MLYRIEYHTTLEYERPVFEQAGELRLLPRSEGYQTLKKFRAQARSRGSPLPLRRRLRQSGALFQYPVGA